MSDGAYTLRAKARDYVGNVSAWTAPVTFIIDVVPPVVTVSTPAANTTIATLPAVQGTATDTGGSGITRVELQILRRSDNKWWTGAGWGVTTTLATDTAGTTWSRSGGLPAANLLPGPYNLYACVYDNNRSVSRSIIVITVK